VNGAALRLEFEGALYPLCGRGNRQERTQTVAGSGFGKKFFGAVASFDALRNAAYTAARNLFLEKLPR
jgi:hypothetical protein